jgi:sodium pump decarboxylase gamma subunit
MNANCFYALTANGRSLVENAKEAGTVTLLGMVAIFAVLALLWLVIEILHRAVSEKTEASEASETSAPVPTERSVSESVPVPTAQTPVESSDDGALIAAITAAISATMADDGYTGGFRVVSFKRASVRRNGRI